MAVSSGFAQWLWHISRGEPPVITNQMAAQPARTKLAEAARIPTQWRASTCTCQLDHDAARDPARRISTHRTLSGLLAYYRCDCGRPGITFLS